MAGFKSKRLVATLVLSLAVLGIGLGAASAAKKDRALIYWGSTDCTASNKNKVIGFAEWHGKNGIGTVRGTVTLPAGQYEVSLLHADCGQHTGGTGNTFKTDGGAQKFSLKAPGVDDPTMYVVFVLRGGGGRVATSGGLFVDG